MMRPILWTIAVLTVASMGAEWWLHRKVGQLVDSEVERLAKVTTVKSVKILAWTFSVFQKTSA